MDKNDTGTLLRNGSGVGYFRPAERFSPDTAGFVGITHTLMYVGGTSLASPDGCHPYIVDGRRGSASEEVRT